MKKLLLSLILGVTLLSNLNAQTKTFSDLVDYELKNLGTMINGNNTVDGYYYFYEGEKLKKKQRQYVVEVLDENLNTIFKKNYIDSKYITLISAKYNQQQLMFCFLNEKEKKFKFVGFDKEGNQKEPYIIDIDSKDFKFIRAMLSKSNNNFAEFHPINNKGFIFSYITMRKKRIMF